MSKYSLALFSTVASMIVFGAGTATAQAVATPNTSVVTAASYSASLSTPVVMLVNVPGVTIDSDATVATTPTPQTPAIQAPVTPNPEWTVHSTLDPFVSGRVFQEQGITYTTHAVWLADALVCKDSIGCGYIFAAESLTGRWQDREEDFILFRDFSLGKTTIELNTGFLELVGKGDFRERVVLSHPLFKDCVGNVYGDIMRGGFKSDVVKGEAVCSVPLFGKVQLSTRLQVSYDSHFERTDGGYNVGFTIPVHIVGHDFSLRPYTKGYMIIVNDRGIPGHDGRVYGFTLTIR